MRFWLRFGDHDVELLPGELVIGRSPKCQLVIDDPLVSRRHARLILKDNAVTVEDLGSVNGVLVNGERVTQSKVIASGDRLVIGHQTFALQAVSADPVSRSRFGQTLSNTNRQTLDFKPESLAPSQQSSERTESTRQGDAFEMLAGVAEKVLALGRGDEAERILGHYLRGLLQTARVQNRVDLPMAERAATYAVRIAEATGKGAWIDYVFDLYTVVRVPLPASVIERLYSSLRTVSAINLSIYRRYVSVLRAADAAFGPSERFLVRRIQGLEALASSK